jgi:hypothetical protein
MRHEVVCTDDGEGVNAELVDLRADPLGERPVDDRQCGRQESLPNPSG